MKKTIFIKNAAIMTATGTILRVLGIFFKVWLASSIGSEGIGLYHLVFSVYTLAATFAASGITVAVTRLCVTEFALGNREGLYKILRRSLTLSLGIAFITFIILLFGSGFIAEKLLSDSRAAFSICVFAFSLPFMAVSCVLKGYFAARRNATVNSSAVLIEQAVRIGLCIILVNKFSRYGIGGGVAAVMAGDTIAEIVSLLYTYICYRFDLRRTRFEGNSEQFSGYRQLLHIASPITAGRYFTTVLRTIENIIMPKALSKASFSYSAALSAFGALKGMALPVLFFPSSILNAFSSLLIPEMSEAMVLKNPKIIKNNTEKVLGATWLMGVVFGCLFFVSGERLGQFIYSDSDSGFFIRILSPLVPLMYLDSISDGILKGLDRQVFAFKGALIDSLSRIVLIYIFVPRYSITAFIYIMYISNLLTFSLNVGKLLSVTGIKPRFFRIILLPILCAIGFATLFSSIFSFIQGDFLYLAALYAATLVSYGTTVLLGTRV